MSRVIVSTRRATPSTRNSTRPAPKLAATTMPKSLSSPRPASKVPPVAPMVSTIRATPRLAPELMPRTNGPASGLRNRVCICSPLTLRADPARTAVTALGSRNLSTMMLQVSFSGAAPTKIFKMSPRGMRTEPTNRLSKKKAMSAPSRAIIASRCQFGWETAVCGSVDRFCIIFR